MKKVLIFIIISSIVLLYACGGAPEDGVTSDRNHISSAAGTSDAESGGSQEKTDPESSAEESQGGAAESSDKDAESATDDSSEDEQNSGESNASEPETQQIYGDPADRSGRKILISENCSYTALGTKHSQYGDDGTRLTDGVTGGEIGWGWTTSAGRFVVDLGEVTEGLADFDVYLRGGNWGIIAPNKAEYLVSLDGKKWVSVGTVTGEGVKVVPADSAWKNYSFPLLLENCVRARYVRFDLSGPGMNYAWMNEICVYKYVEAEPVKMHEFSGSESFDNTGFKNKGHMGDDDGPAYCVYSKPGYNKAEMIFELSAVEASTTGSRGAKVNGFVFLGMDVYNAGGHWANCCDAGLIYTGESGGWRLFWATVDDGTGKRGWFSGGKQLDETRNYKITLDSSQKDGYATVYISDVDDGRVVDKAEFRLLGSKNDGSNTSCYTDIAIDWSGEATWVDSSGNKTEDWQEVMLACVGQNIFMKNVRIYGCALYKGDSRFEWTEDLTDRRGLCPDSDTEVHGKVITVSSVRGDFEYVIDIDIG